MKNSIALPTTAARRQRSVLELSIVAVYLILASVWIAGSDMMLIRYAIDQPQPGLIHAVRAVNFFVTAAVLIYFVMRHLYGGWRLAEQHRTAEINHAHEKSRNLSSHVQTLREEDRIWVAREIHDELGQLLTSIKMQLRLIENRLNDREDRTLNPVIDKLVEASELVDTTIASIQRISAGLRPSTLDNLGLATALVEEAEQFSQRTGIICAVRVSHLPETLPPEITTTAFRIFQEALTNVARHAEARRIDAHFTATRNLLKLVIHDDGKGIDPAAIDDPRSLGLIGMTERAESVGGFVVFSRNLEKGTDVVLTVPLPMATPKPRP
ncbi:MAG: sensor histidine kinase [Verrucomicrobiota bacterium]